MKIVIEISDEEYQNVMRGRWEGNPLANYIESGTPLPKLPKEHEMREATPEELESVNNYIKSISKTTGVNIWEVQDADSD